MWQMRLHTLSPLTRLTSIKRRFKLTQAEQDNFNKIKRIVARGTLLTYLYFNKAFKIHTDASAFQLGAVIINNVEPIALLIIRLTDAQQQYTLLEI